MKVDLNILQSFFQSSPDLIAIVSKDTKFIYANKIWEKKLGYSLKYILGRSYLEFIYPEDLERSKKEEEDLTQRKSAQNFVNRYICKSGELLPLEWRATYDEDTKCFYCVVRDLKEIEEVSKLKKTLVEDQSQLMVFSTAQNNLSREISKMAPLLFNVESYLEKSLQTPDQRENLLQQAKENLTRLSEIFHYLQNTSALLSSTTSPHKNELFLNEVFDQIKPALADYSREQGLEITIKKAPKHDLVKGHPVELALVFCHLIHETTHLITNEKKIPSPPRLEISFDQAPAHIQISFKFSPLLKDVDIDKPLQKLDKLISCRLEKHQGSIKVLKSHYELEYLITLSSAQGT